MKIIKYFIEYIFIKLLFFKFKILGYKTASNLGEKIGRLFGPIFRSRNKIINNLKDSNIGNSDEERNSIINKMWGNYGRILAEYNFLKKFKNGDYNNDMFLNMAFQKFVVGTQLPYNNYSMPEGVALKLSSDFGLDINSHYLNPSDTIYSGEVYANLHLVDPDELDHIAHIFSLSNGEIVLPPNEETTLEATFMYPGGFGMDLETDSIFVFQLFIIKL